MHAVSPPEVSLRTHLLDDHRRIENLMNDMLEACAHDDREGLSLAWTALDAGLSAHLEAEEKLLIPILMRTNERDARAIVSEHRHIRTRLVELGTAVDLHTVRVEAAKSFVDELRAHASHEDTILYQHCDDALSREEHLNVLETLADLLKERVGRIKKPRGM